MDEGGCERVRKAAELIADELEEYGYVYSYEDAAENLRVALGRNPIYRETAPQE